MSKIQIATKRIMANRKFRQALIEGPTSLPQGTENDSSVEMFTGFEDVRDALAGFEIGQLDLKKRLISLIQAILPSSNREASLWRVFNAEFGPDAPITRAIDSKVSDSKVNSVSQHHFVDHYRRSV